MQLKNIKTQTIRKASLVLDNAAKHRSTDELRDYLSGVKCVIDHPTSLRLYSSLYQAVLELERDHTGTSY